MPNAKRLTPVRLLTLLLLLAALAAMARSLFTGLEIDEQYAFSLSYRLLRGDALLNTMWEPHQLSALPLAPVLALYMAVTGGTAGILLFVRVLMLAAKAALSAAAYRVFAGAMPRAERFLLALALFVYTPKWFIGPDYVSQQYHFTLAAFLCLYAYYAGAKPLRRRWLPVLAAVFACFGYLAFPQSAAAVVPLLIGLWRLGAMLDEPRLWGRVPRGCALFFGGCAACGVAFLLFVLRGLPLNMLLPRLSLILNDPQYSFSTGERLALLGRQAASSLRFWSVPMAAALVWALFRFWRERDAKRLVDRFLTVGCGLVLARCFVDVFRSVSLDVRQFVPVLAVLGGWVFWADRRAAEHRTARAALFWLGWLPGLAAYLFILRSTLIALPTTYMYLMFPALCGAAALALHAEPADTLPRRGALAVLALTAALTVFCRLYLVQVTGWRPDHTAFNTPLVRIESGPAAGIWADAAAADMQAALTAALAEARPGELVCQGMGYPHGLGYLMDGGTLRVGQASVISGTDSDPRFLLYYQEFPEKIPDILIFDNNEMRDMAEYQAAMERALTLTGRHTVTVGTASLDVMRVEK